jgi:spermidine synthase
MADGNFGRALQFVPAFALIAVVLFAAYWVLGLVPWPRLAIRDRARDWFGEVVLDQRSGFTMVGLAVISLVSLYLELLLIRWISSEIRIFAFFKSLVLIACFLGFGLGCYVTRSRIRLAYVLVPLLAIVFLIELPWDALRQLVASLSDFVGWLSDIHVWYQVHFGGEGLLHIASTVLAFAIILPLFGLIALTFIPLGQMVGWYLEHAPNGVRAYSINVAASVVGIWLYTLLCFVWSPPVVWMAIFGVGLVAYLAYIRALRTPVLVSLAAILVLMVVGIRKPQWWAADWSGTTTLRREQVMGAPQKHWSPYQKLTLIPFIEGTDTVSYLLNTNDSWYQRMVNLSPEAVTRRPELFAEEPVATHQYNLPYRFYPKPPRVLIAGAGFGNDAASAVRNGAGQVDAVEIDPMIVRLGREKHFEHPYTAPNVNVIVDDARAFIQRTKEKYDLVVFSILDSHTTSSYYTNIRIDNYVYTVEALRQVRQVLKPDGLFVMSFSGARPWFAGRLKAVLSEAFGQEPLTFQSGVYFFVAGSPDRIQAALTADTALASFVDARQQVAMEPASLTTDDWPYLYQQHRGIPVIVWLLSLGLIAICALGVWRFKRSSAPFMWHFFFLGAAFMLMEVQIISKAALLFGTTWLVNSIIITALLTFILLANVVAQRVPNLPRAFAYLGLLVTLGIGYFVPANALFLDSLVLRALAVAVVFCSPVFFAGLVFITSFREIGFRAEAFGANLLGSLVGGLLESLSYAVGIKALVLLAAMLYLASMMTAKRAPALVPAVEPAGSG